MKIAIVGAGWLGCHLAYKLKNSHDITLYDKSSIFAETSYKNQNRLHLGYHYARNHDTRKMCQLTFDKFVDDYYHLTQEIDKNIYAVPKDKSLIDFKTYIKIFDDYDYDWDSHPDLLDIEGAIRVQERYIDPFLSKTFFEKELQSVLKIENVTEAMLGEMKESFDLIINCTNNMLNSIQKDIFYESCKVYVYRKLGRTEFDALTLVDGDLWSIFPYKNDLYTVTHVKYTPNTTDQKFARHKMEIEIVKNYPNFMEDFVYDHSFFSTKVKYKNQSATRIPIIRHNGKVIDCFTGKIQGMYVLEDYVRKLCE